METKWKWLALAAVLGAGPAGAQGWHAYASLGAGVTLDHFSDWRAKGPTLQAWLGVETPPGLSLGAVFETTQTWGQQFAQAQNPSQMSRVQLDYTAVGIEARLRFLGDKPVTPWLGARLAKSWAKPFTPNSLGELRREDFDVTSMAFRVGLDGWFGDHWGISIATALQFCDLKFTKDADNSTCAKPLQSITAGPVLRF
ncbi:hypothetical protein [Corallococcus terminator]|uniref:Outer membrane protein beta-barrel domain-containing protein n=1 Tax=Corallococcus terminator TaxID=2316733 RepID=A0A3A8IPF9_9BACT|nr:hypothetical protein [Corallococcus terminator]RKG85262.1 hypothetical protein D7V88_20230 [Corallococcus terminator]